MKLYTLALILLAFTMLLSAQDSQQAVLKKNIDKIDVALSSYSAPMLIEARNELQNLVISDSSHPLPLYYTAYTGYKLLEMSLGKDSTGLFARYCGSAEQEAEKVIRFPELASEGKTLLAAIYMMKIAHNWSEAMSLTKPLYALLAEAQKLNPENPRAYYIQGMMKLKTPEMFGGSKEEALKLFIKASALFEAEAGTVGENPHWGYLECLTWAGQAYAETGNFETAKFYYTKVLQINPQYGWVKYQLLPALEKKMNNE